MKILLLSTLAVLLLLFESILHPAGPSGLYEKVQQKDFVCSASSPSVVLADKPKENSNNNKDNNIFNPVSAIVTKNGGAIVTMKATLNPPIKTEGYHEVSVAWCNRQEWFDCLASSNKTSECRCSAPGTDVEESVRFNLDGDSDGDEDESSNSNTRSSSSCTVVSQRWEQDPDYEAHFKRFRDEMKLKIDKESRLAQTYRNRMNIINEKFVNFNKKENVSDVEEFIKKISRLEDERALMGEKIDECNRRIEEWRKASIRPGTENLARIMKLELFCASSLATDKKRINFSELTAQATFAKARWEPSHILLIDTSDENDNNDKKKDTSSSEVRMAAKLSHETHCDWKDVKVSLRQGAPGEDTTTTQDPPNDSPLEPWVLTVRDHAPPRTTTNNLFNQNELLRQRQQKFSKSKSGAQRNKRSAPPSASSRRADESATASFSAPVGSGIDEALMDIEEEGAFAEDESFGGGDSATDLTQDPASGTEIVGSFTEETKLPHRVSVPKNSHSIVEIGRGSVTSSMHRVAAAYRCRSHATSSSSSICSLPVFLRANVTNTNKFSILGGPTRVIVDGVPFNPFGRARMIQNNINSNTNNMFQQNQFQQQQQQQSMQPTFSSSLKSASFRPAIAPESWGWVELGEDTRVTIQRYEKSNIMSASQAQQGKGWWEKMITNEEEKNFVAVKFEMKVTNTRKTPVTIDLRDQFPRTNSDEIEIKLDGETLKNKFLAVKSLPTATDNNNDGDSASSNTDKPSSCSYRHPTDKTKCISTRNGGEELQWNVEVGPSGTVVIPFGFTVTWPKKKFVHGLA